MNNQYRAFPWVEGNVGQVFPTEPEFTRRQSVSGIDYSHVCGSEEDFAKGVTYDAGIDPVVYDDDGIPTCCPRTTRNGGLLFGGSSVVKQYAKNYSVGCPGPGDVLIPWPIRTLWDRQWLSAASSPYNFRVRAPVLGLGGSFDALYSPGGQWRTFPTPWNGRGSRAFIWFAGMTPPCFGGPLTVTEVPDPYWYLDPVDEFYT